MALSQANSGVGQANNTTSVTATMKSAGVASTVNVATVYSSQPFTPATGWSTAYSSSSGTGSWPYVTVIWKSANVTTSLSLGTLSASGAYTCGVESYNGASTTAPIAQVSVNEEPSGASPVTYAASPLTPSVTGESGLLFLAAPNGSGTPTTPTGWTEDDATGTGTSREVAVYHQDSLTVGTQYSPSTTGTSNGSSVTWTTFVLINPSGALQNFLTLSAGLSAAGAIAKASAKSLSASLSAAGTLVKALTRTLASSIAPGGTIAKALTRGFAASQNASGAIARTVSVAMTAVATITGAISKSTSRGFSATLSDNGSIGKLITRGFAASETLQGSLSSLRSRILTFAASVSSAGSSLGKNVARGFASTQSVAGSLTKANLRKFAATAQSTAAFGKQITRNITSSIAPAAASFARSTAKSIIAAVTTDASISKSLKRTLAASESESGAVDKADTKALSATETSSGNVQKGTGKTLSAVLNQGASLARAVALAMTASVSDSGSFATLKLRLLQFSATIGAATASWTRSIAKNFAASIQTSAALSIRAFGAFVLSFTATISAAGAQTKATTRRLNAAATEFASTAKQTTKRVFANYVTYGSLKRSTSALFAARVNSTAAASKRLAKNLAATIAPAVRVTKSVFAKFAASVSVPGAFAHVHASILRFFANTFQTGRLTKQSSIGFGSVLNLAVALPKTIGKRLAATATETGSVSVKRIVIRIFAASLAAGGGIKRAIARGFVASGGLYARTTKGVTLVPFHANVVTFGDFGKRIAKVFAAVVSAVAAVNPFRTRYVPVTVLPTQMVSSVSLATGLQSFGTITEAELVTSAALKTSLSTARVLASSIVSVVTLPTTLRME